MTEKVTTAVGAEEATPAKKTYRRSRQLTPAKKAELFTLWRQGDMTVDQLAKRFDKDRSTLLRLFKAQGIVKGSDKEQVQARVEAAVQQAVVDDATEIAKRIRDTKDEHYRMATGLAKLTWNIVVEQQKKVQANPNTARMVSVHGDLKALKTAAEALRIAREERYAVLGIVDGETGEGDELPTLSVTELTAEDIKKMHKDSAMQAADELDIDDLELGDDDGVLSSEGADGDINERVETE